MQLKTLNDLMAEELQDLYSAETQIIDALPKLMAKTTTSELKDGMAKHLEETKRQKERLDAIFQQLGMDTAEIKVCHGMQGLIAEGNELLEENEPSVILDLALIGAARRVEHYEIAGYTAASTIAEQLQLTTVVEKLQQTLAEEETENATLEELEHQLMTTMPSDELPLGAAQL